MAKKKYDLITDLYAEAVKEVTASPENWMSFLCSACRNVRLPFDEQILIYAQRPEASAVLPMNVWNEKFGRWVKRDSKGIAVFDKDSPKLRLKYYYDVSDTQEGRFRRLLRPVPLWEVAEEYQPDVRETLANAFGVDDTVTQDLRKPYWRRQRLRQKITLRIICRICLQDGKAVIWKKWTSTT